MKNKLFFLCLLAALSFPFTAHSQYGDWSDEENSTLTVEDSLWQVAAEYYADPEHWIFIVEEEPVVDMWGDSTSYDNAGLKHAYFSWRNAYMCIPKSSNLKYIPCITVISDSYAQELPIEGKDKSHFQMIRNAIFPFAAQFPIEMSSKAIIQEYANLNRFPFHDFYPDELSMIEQNHLRNRLDTLSNVKKITFWSDIRDLWSRNVWHGKQIEDDICTVAAGSIDSALKKYFEYYTDNYDIIDAGVNRLNTAEENDYVMLNYNTFLPYQHYCTSMSLIWRYEGGDVAIMVFPTHTESVNLQSCLKDTSYKVTIFTQFVDEDCYDIVRNENGNDLQKNIIPILKEGSVLYDYYVQNFYLNWDVFTFFRYNKRRCEGSGKSQYQY